MLVHFYRDGLASCEGERGTARRTERERGRDREQKEQPPPHEGENFVTLPGVRVKNT